MNKTPFKKTRIVLCMGQKCNRDGRADPFYDRLKSLLGYPGLLCSNAYNIKWEMASCVNFCEEGPNLVIYPQGDWHHEVDAATLESILAGLGITAAAPDQDAE